MKKYLYDDFFNGLFHIIVTFLPIIVELVPELSENGNPTVFISLVIAISGALYSNRDVYSDNRYRQSIRIRLEMIISSIALTVSLFWSADITYSFFTNKKDVLDYQVPMYIYISGMSFCWIETFLVSCADLGVWGRIKSHSKKSANILQDLDITVGNIN